MSIPNKIPSAASEGHTSKWSARFIVAAIVQGAIITGLTLFFVGAQVLISGINIIQFLSLSFEGPAKWFFLGYIFYLILVVAIAVTAVFYQHLEVNMGRRISGFRSILAWIHLIGMNVGGAATTITMIFAGLAGSGIINIILGGGSAQSLQNVQPNLTVIDRFVMPIAALAGLLSIGVIAGGIGFVASYFKRRR